MSEHSMSERAEERERQILDSLILAREKAKKSERNPIGNDYPRKGTKSIIEPEVPPVPIVSKDDISLHFPPFSGRYPTPKEPQPSTLPNRKNR